MRGGVFMDVYIKGKLYVLDELHIKLTDEQKDFMRGVKIRNSN